ncbi:hypothetical protein L198_05905 [Cryptococcus wingfieldii CBS 7118]|uniref:Uncharacterized protein n=1 Tax=Cryptococcus wingfieldii CBS 7118 TaxID=1295528 RepID=A0A1E3IUK0_9TREE|nr:hypothetical protein L198_05905 [Cryptococcus wingfieldii CBS 7118]ODN91391.1 hypothetical protein L198_05905 [Cryptococcus wingfieldii CBS 7118]
MTGAASRHSRPNQSLRVTYTYSGTSQTRHLSRDESIDHWPDLVIDRDGDTNAYTVSGPGSAKGTFTAPCSYHNGIAEIKTVMVTDESQSR